MDKRYKARIAASKAGIDTTIRTVVAEMRDRSEQETIEAIQKRHCIAVDPDYVRALRS